MTREKHLIKNKCLRDSRQDPLHHLGLLLSLHCNQDPSRLYVVSLSFDLRQVGLPGVSSAVGSGSGQGKNSCQF